MSFLRALRDFVMNSRRQLVFSLIVIPSAALALAMLTTGHDWGDDFAGNIIQASGLLHGTPRESVAHVAFTMRGSSRSYAPIAYPWGFPALLAPVYLACGGLNIFCLKLINVPSFALFLVAFFVLIARRLLLVDSALAVSILAFSPVLLPYQNNILADIPFLFFSTLSVLVIESVIVFPNRPESSPRANVWLGIVLFVTVSVRISGLLFLPTLFLTQAVAYRRRRAQRRDWRRALAVAVIPYVVFGLLTLAVLGFLPRGEASYVSHFHRLSAEELSENLSMYAVLLIEFFDSIPRADVVYVMLIPFLITGAVVSRTKDFHLLIYSGLTLLLLIAWPDPQGLRYMFPLLPFVVYFSYRGMQAAACRLRERYRGAGVQLTRACWMAILTLFVATSFGLARANLADHRAPEDGPFDAASVELFGWIRTNTAPENVVIFDKPRAMRLLTDRDALLIDRCDQLGRGHYVVIRQRSGGMDQVRPDEVTSCNRSLDITSAFANREYQVYRIFPKS